MKLKSDDMSFPREAKRMKIWPSDSPPEASQDLNAVLQTKKKSRSKRWSTISGSKNLDFHYLTKVKDPKEAYESVCICALFQDKNDDADDDENDCKYDSMTKAQACGNGAMCFYNEHDSSPSSRLYTVSKAGLNKYSVTVAMLMLRDPDAFDMYTFNDHLAYGALEIVQNIMFDFDEAYKLMDWREAWAVIEGLALFMLLDEGMAFGSIGDGEIAQDAAGVIARMVLASLAMLEAESQIGLTLGVVHIGWIIDLYLELAEKFRSTNLLGFICPSNTKRFEFDADNLDLYLLSYARRHDIPVQEVNKLEIDNLAMPRLDTKDPWNWKKGYGEYKTSWAAQWKMICCIYRRCQTLTVKGDCFDISTWTPAERKRAHFEKKDPLPNNVLEMLRQGLVLHAEDLRFC
jgi:hypothetical protein